MDISLSTTVKQEQNLSPQMLQSLALLPMSILELQTFVQTEIESNPALEIPQSDFDSTNSSDESDVEEDSYDTTEDEEYSDRKQQAIENSSVKGETLSEHLLSQLGLQKISEAEIKIGQMLIGNLDANGFFILPLQTLFEKENFSSSEINKVVKLLQGFEPSGICVSDFRQSLVVQARNSGMMESDLKIFETLVENHLESIKARKYKEVASALHISEEDLQTFISIMKSFTPFPGRAYDADTDHFVIPEFSVHNKDGVLVLQMNDTNFPELKISEEFESLSNNLSGPQSKEAAVYIRNSVSQAKSLINQLAMRYKTLYNCAKALVEFQHDYFMQGPMYLKPMTLKDIADKISVHETTMSRLAQSKWIETDWGLIQLKSLFTQGVQSSQDGETISRNVVKENIAKILEENPKLSDQKISDKLLELGIKCARRTVSKYRSELNIDSSYSR